MREAQWEMPDREAGSDGAGAQAVLGPEPERWPQAGKLVAEGPPASVQVALPERADGVVAAVAWARLARQGMLEAAESNQPAWG